MIEKKTLYISDLDGTLLNRSAELSEYSKNSLNRMLASGINFSIATARTIASAGKIMADVSLDIPMILMNGVLIYDLKRKQHIQINELGVQTVVELIGALKALNVTGLMYELKNDELMTYYESLDAKPIRDFIEERKTRYYKTFRQANKFSDVSPEHIIYFTLLDTHDKILPVCDVLAKLNGINLTMYKDNYSEDLWYLEIFSKSASKQNAVIFLREMYGFERVICFGDNLNDLPMFSASDVRIAVENAKMEVKAAADLICDTNDNDGVVKWIEQNALIDFK